jgi:hypothetical protein
LTTRSGKQIPRQDLTRKKQPRRSAKEPGDPANTDDTQPPGEFPSTPAKKPSFEPPIDPESSSESDMASTGGGPSGGGGKSRARPQEEEVPAAFEPLKFTLHLPAKFTGEGKDLKPEAFDRWATELSHFLLLQGKDVADPTSGLIIGSFCEGKATDAYHQCYKDFGGNVRLRGSTVLDYLKGRFQSSITNDLLYNKFNQLQQVNGTHVKRITDVATDLMMYKDRIEKGSITKYILK